MQENVKERERSEIIDLLQEQKELEEERRQPEYFLELFKEIFKITNNPKNALRMDCIYIRFYKSGMCEVEVITIDKNGEMEKKRKNKKIRLLEKEFSFLKLKPEECSEIQDFLESTLAGRCKGFRSNGRHEEIVIEF